MTKLMLALVFGAGAAWPAFAQDAPADRFDSRWAPYLGCWRIVQEQMGTQTVPLASGMMVCVQPSGQDGVTMTTTVDGTKVLEQTIVANRTAQAVSQADCQGTQTSEWSRDGERLFTRVELECTGRPKRVVSGITQIAQGRWVDTQAIVVDGGHDVRLRRYQRTSDQFTGRPALAGSLVSPTSPMSIEDVIEASAKVLSPALEAALVEAGGRFTLNSRALKQLADAGVSPNVIDLMVAQAYPDRFQVERSPTYPRASAFAGGNASGGSTTTVVSASPAYPYPMDDLFYGSYYYSPFAYPYYWGTGYDPYLYGYGYSYGPGYRNYYDNYYYGSPGIVYVPGNRDTGDTAQPGSPDSRGGDGIVVNGRGYTRVRPSSGSSERGNGGDSGSSATAAQGTTRSARGTRPVSSGTDSSGSSSGSSSGGSTSGGGSSSGGSSGGGSDGGGRTAQPR